MVSFYEKSHEEIMKQMRENERNTELEEQQRRVDNYYLAQKIARARQNEHPVVDGGENDNVAVYIEPEDKTPQAVKDLRALANKPPAGSVRENDNVANHDEQYPEDKTPQSVKDQREAANRPDASENDRNNAKRDAVREKPALTTSKGKASVENGTRANDPESA
jgi:hypothetical protein